VAKQTRPDQKCSAFLLIHLNSLRPLAAQKPNPEPRLSRRGLIALMAGFSLLPKTKTAGLTRPPTSRSLCRCLPSVAESLGIIPTYAEAVPKRAGSLGAYAWVRFMDLVEHSVLRRLNQEALDSTMLCHINILIVLRRRSRSW
jgi:hypothetical protein